MPHMSVDTERITWLHKPKVSMQFVARHVGILLFDRFALLGAGVVAEMFHTANEIATAHGGDDPPYDVQFLSMDGGSISSASCARIWTDGVDARYSPGFDVLFVAGGYGANAAARDERLLNWLRSVRAIEPIAEGRIVLAAAGLVDHDDVRHTSPYLAPVVGDSALSEASDRHDSSKSALMFIKRDLGLDVARSVVDSVMPDMGAALIPGLTDGGTMSVGEKIRAAARWMEANCDRPVSVADAAHVAAMSERNFLRRFKHEMQVTPSDYLLQVRLRMACNFLTETELPVDKIARRSGTGNGDRLAKIFRKRMALSPTEYRARSRTVAQK
jgi:transcriptional regulator GlxA family with amidase domain